MKPPVLARDAGKDAMGGTGKIALVTGVDRAATLAEDYSVVFAGRRPEPLAETASPTGDAVARMLAVPTDVG